MPSFDTVSELNWVEIKNALDQANKEISTRFDFKGSDSRVELNEKEKIMTIYADDDFKLSQVDDVLLNKFAKRNVDSRSIEKGKPEKIGGDKMKRVDKLKEGLESELAKKVVKLLKDSKTLKVSGSIQGIWGGLISGKYRLDSLTFSGTRNTPDRRAASINRRQTGK